VVALLYWVYIERIMVAEEAYLSETFGDEFREWSSRTPAFIPNPRLWRAPHGRPQWKRVLSEHNALLALAASVTLFEFLEDAQHGIESWTQWYADHADLTWFLGVAMCVSLLAILIRRWPSPRRAELAAAPR
jgi:hypothetical protein